jgi:hypothetical protein
VKDPGGAGQPEPLRSCLDQGLRQAPVLNARNGGPDRPASAGTRSHVEGQVATRPNAHGACPVSRLPPGSALRLPRCRELIDLFITHQMMVAGRKGAESGPNAAPEPWAGASPYKAERNSLKTTFPAETPCLRAQSLAAAKP